MTNGWQDAAEVDLSQVRLFSTPPSGGQYWVPSAPRTAAEAQATQDPAGAADQHHRYADLDWAQVKRFRSAVADLLRKEAVAGASPADLREQGKELIIRVLQNHSRNALAGDHQAWPRELEQAYRKAVFDATFGFGRLQPLLDDPEAENIEMYGYDRVRVVYGDGRRVAAAPVADSDEELVETLQLIATHADSGARPFSYPEPSVTMLLGKRHRLHAIGFNLSPRPLVTIRQHKHLDVTLDQMVALGMLEGDLADFLVHAVRAHKSIVIAGAQGSGKTTMMRAIADAIPKHERIGTIETAFELLLHELPDQYPNVAPMQARAGGGESAGGARVAGAKSVADLLVEAFTMNLDRILVGEVKQDVELVSMLHAMTASNGSLSTVHAKSGRHALTRLVSLATDRGGDHTSASHRVADNIDLIVFCAQVDNRWRNGGIQRRVTEVHQVMRGEAQHPATTKPLYLSDDDDSPATWKGHPTWFTDLERLGYKSRFQESYR